MKFFSILLLNFSLLSNYLSAETLPTKSKILRQSRQCLKESENQVCRKLVSKIERLQLVVFDQNKFKCQSSLLGLQSELIEAYFLKNPPNERISIMIPHVIKNC